MTRYAAAIAWLTAAWVALQRDLTVGNVAAGVALGAILLAVFPFAPAAERLRVDPVALVQFAAVFAWSVVKANARVAWEVITPWNRIHEGVVAVRVRSDHPIVMTMVSHAIILAPGTMVIDIDRDPEPVLFIHALHLRSPEQVRGEVLRLERLALAALGHRVPATPGGEPSP